ncbi:MAG: asparagine synthase (glutamine-hydrolyzing) [Thermoleophilia bacterium]|nr:asparagine synthase (glutamine-hydrolyzing) [Thermoleophilia bacterium]
MSYHRAVCGIAGIWERSGRPVNRAALERMAAILQHRGPDGSGIHLDGELGLANRRLAIVDPSPAGEQPMGLESRGLWLTYNGEIHNYVELRKELESSGARFRTDTDTEVVLEAYAAWGMGCFERFNGMWALGLWDGRERQLVLSRDRFGIKPLCYSLRGGRICFASEPKAILTAFPQEREPDNAEIGRFLAGHYPDTGEATFFAGISNLPAAHCLVVTPTSIGEIGYWGFQPGVEAPMRDAEEQFRELLRESVRIRMRSDVPVGACLSGGLDSSAIAALVEVPPGRPMQCFSLRYDGSRDDESRYAAAAARDDRFSITWVRPAGDDLLDTIGRIVWHHDAPTPLRGRLAQWAVMQEAGKHVKVVLDGQGGDELLAGYSRYVFPYVVDRLRRPTRAGGIVRELSDLARIETRSRLWFLSRTPLQPAQRALGLPPWVCGRAEGRAFRRSVDVSPGERERPYASSVNNMLWHELRHEGLPEVLHAEDALSMAFSIESRTPFLDHRLVELCFSLPYTEKIGGGWTKSLLRRSLAGDVPPEILARRRKLGFSSPAGTWLRRDDTWRGVRDLLLDPRCLGRGILDGRRLERALRVYERAPEVVRVHRTVRIWAWITLELWFRQFIDA